MLNRIVFVLVTVAAGAIGAAAVIAPFVKAYGNPPDRHLAQAAAMAPAPAQDANERGRYLVKITGCNDCHTANYASSDGKVPEKDWLAGDALGWQGPWGTSYAPNLRMYFQTLDEASWIVSARSREFRPPMPAPSLRAMSDEDLRAIYRYVRALGPAGSAAPAYVPPGQKATGPVVTFPAPPN
jgi:mono/diheme cytochrome c family protein